MLSLSLKLLIFSTIFVSETLSSKKSEANLVKANQIAADAYKLLDQPCDRKIYEAIMPFYWAALFEEVNEHQTASKFELTYWNVSIRFEPIETTKTVPGFQPGTSNLSQYVVHKNVQEAWEASICSAPGGLMECRIDGKCGCLMHANTTDDIVNTTRVNPKTGALDAKGTQCFVQQGKRCLVSYITENQRANTLEFTCVHFARCLRDSGLCDEKMSSRSTKASLYYSLGKIPIYLMFPVFILNTLALNC